MHFLTFLLLFVSSAASGAIEFVDDRGETLALEHPARRVISLAPHLTELMFAAGAGNYLVGVVRDSDYPPMARNIAQIGDAASADFERVVALQPDLVLAWGSGNRVSIVERLRALGFPVLVLEPRTLEDIPRHIGMLGRLAGTDAVAQDAVRSFSQRAAKLRARHQHARPVNVMFEMWHRPIMTVNGHHMISDVLRMCGARNVFADLPQLAAEISLEQVLMRDPEVIVVGSEAAGAGMADWKDYPYLKAVRRSRVYNVSADLITRQTPRILDAAEQICVDLDGVRAKPD
jgi:iron complex transport system substrate-binding protein